MLWEIKEEIILEVCLIITQLLWALWKMLGLLKYLTEEMMVDWRTEMNGRDVPRMGSSVGKCIMETGVGDRNPWCHWHS